MGITQHTCGTDNAQACVNLQLLLGNLGRPGAGVNPLRGQNNVQGACDMGALPDLLPGYKPVADPEARGRLEADWRVRIPERPGLTVTEIVDAAGRGTIRGLYVLGENVAMTDPDLGHVHRCLAACEFLVVQEIFLSETARFAHVVLPGAAAAEKAGTFTNTERRVQLLAPVVPPPGQARPDWWIVAEIGRRVARLDAGTGRALAWPYTSPEEILHEVARLARIYGGISHARLGREGLHWPCPDPEHPGTPILHVGGPVRGRGLLRPVPHRPPAEEPDAEFPLVLTTGRILPHYHGGTMTRRVAGLEWRQPEAFVEMHPADAAALGLGDGTAVTLRSRRGSLTTRLRVTPGIAPGTVFMPFHYAEAAANVLTHAALDPVARIPEFKVSAVAVEAAGDPAAEAPAAVLRPAHPP
jgi:predicted molibdopterin-dependent oxidoreductase YjgC